MEIPFFENGGNGKGAERGGSGGNGVPDPLREVPQSLLQGEYQVTNTQIRTRVGYPHNGNVQDPVPLGMDIFRSTMRKSHANLQEAQKVADELNSQKPAWQRVILRAKVIKVESNY